MATDVSVDLPPTIPVSIVTGFLGSGKTTLLSRLLRSPAMADVAVIINEFGEIGLDHHLVEASSDDVVLLAGGCLCCTVRGDLIETLCQLYERRERGELTRFRRVVVETTGLADPAPILHALMDEPRVRSAYSLDGVITTVDALFGERELGQHVECVKQAAVADRLVLTKTDLVDAARIDALRVRLRQINPGAPIVVARNGQVDPGSLFGAAPIDAATGRIDVQRWLRLPETAGAGAMVASPGRWSVASPSTGGRIQGARLAAHDATIRSHCFVYDEPLDWRYFSPNLALLVSRHAEKLLRVKGILNVAGEPSPVVIHGVQHQFQRLRLPRWVDEDRRSRLVLIARGLEHELLVRWLQDRELAT